MAYDPSQMSMASILALQKQFPGRAPGGTGPTGILPGDAKGWSDMENQQTDALNMENAAQGKAPLTVKVDQSGGLGGSSGTGIPNADKSLGDSPEWWQSAGAQGASTPVPGKPGKVQWSGRGLPASMQGLETGQ